MSRHAKEHYEHHLARFYSWMVGDFEDACRCAETHYEAIKLPAGNGRLAIDLGCGHGVHTIPIAKRGYETLAIDSSDFLLRELESLNNDLPIRAINDDLLSFARHLDGRSAFLIACMGDTITHMESTVQVESLFHDVAANLSSQGLFTISFRDYANHELTGTDRFIPVRSDENRIHVCFLEYQHNIVLVHDILHERDNGNDWRMSVSHYPKIRLAASQLLQFGEQVGLVLKNQYQKQGMCFMTFSKLNSA